MSAHTGRLLSPAPGYNAALTPLGKNHDRMERKSRRCAKRGDPPPLAAYQNRVFALSALSPGRSGANPCIAGVTPGSGGGLHALGACGAGDGAERRALLRRHGSTDGRRRARQSTQGRGAQAFVDTSPCQAMIRLHGKSPCSLSPRADTASGDDAIGRAVSLDPQKR